LTSPSSQTSPNGPTSPADQANPADPSSLVDQSAQDAAAGQPACGKCGGHKLRRSHSRSGLQKLVRRYSSWDRYACRSCGHRGWARGKVAPRAERLAAAESALRRGRKAETRDHRLKRKVRLRAFLVVGVSLGLGILAALFLQRCGVSPPAE
jgi:hypothetical protein